MSLSERSRHISVKNLENSNFLQFEITGQAKAPFTGSEVLFALDEEGQEVAIKFSSYNWGAKREWRGLQKVYQAHVPVPVPLAIIQDSNNRLGIISSKVHGFNLFETKHPKDQLKFRLGTIIRNMHNNTTISGEEWRHSQKNDFTFYDKNLSKWQKSQLAELQNTSPAIQLFRKFSLTAIDQLPNVSPVFIHNDLHDDQVLINERGDIIVLDVEFWREDNPLNDLATYLFHSIRTQRPWEDFVSFSQGYLGENSYSENDKNLIAFYLLNAALAGLNHFSQHRKQELWTAQLYLSRIQEFLTKETLWKTF